MKVPLVRLCDFTVQQKIFQGTEDEQGSGTYGGFEEEEKEDNPVVESLADGWG